MHHQGQARYLATPRVLLFMQRDGRRLFIEGAAHKWWRGRLNGIGGSVEAGEGILAAARRECHEESGLVPPTLTLAAIAHVRSEPPVLLFIFTGELPPGDLAACDEGTFHWLTEAEALSGRYRLMDDLNALLPHLWQRQASAPPLLLTIHFDDAANPLVRAEG